METVHDLSSIITEELYKMYGIKDENTLYKYLYIRATIRLGKKKVNDIELIKFIFEELNVTVYNNLYVNYKEEEYNIYTVSSEFFDNLRFRAELLGNLEIDKLLNDVYNKGYKKSIKYRKLNDYKKYIKYNRLLELNERFNVVPKDSFEVKGFINDINHNPYKRTLEENLDAILSANRMLGSRTTTHITEEELEDYLCKNIETIEKGIIFMQRQVEVPGGIVDIIAMDKNNNVCVIEIKIKEDKNLVWQAMHYPEEIKKQWRNRNVRMITIAPDYSEHMLKALRNIDNVEIMEYDIMVSMDKITELNIHKVEWYLHIKL